MIPKSYSETGDPTAGMIPTAGMQTTDMQTAGISQTIKTGNPTAGMQTADANGSDHSRLGAAGKFPR